jgi:hypothetical protein
MIDIDEAKFKLETQNRKRGKVIRERRVNAWGKYKRGEEGTNLIMAISGSRQTPFSFHKLYSEGGTDMQRFYGFMVELIDYLDTNFPGRGFCFTMDNLNIHKHPMVLYLIYNSGHRVVFRAPYWSCDGPIEYVFNTIQTHLQMQYNAVASTAALENELNCIIGGLGSFKPYFLHVNFPDN